MTSGNAKQLRDRLKKAGLTTSAVEAAWPRWWSEEAEGSLAARVDLRFSLARNLGLEPHSLLEDDQAPNFVWRDEARFKHLAGESAEERGAITSFGTALGSLLISATPPQKAEVAGQHAETLRRLALAGGAPYVRLLDLLSLCWSVGIPVIHLRVFPLPQKRMAAMSVRIGDRCAVLLGKDSHYPPHVAFYLGHELGHIALRHLRDDPVLVDLEDENPAGPGDDAEEQEADSFALELLTGDPRPKVLPENHASGAALAQVALNSAQELQIEPGTLALCFGYSTGRWHTANAAIKRIYSTSKPVWSEVNRIAKRELDLSNLGADARSYLEAVLGSEA